MHDKNMDTLLMLWECGIRIVFTHHSLQAQSQTFMLGNHAAHTICAVLFLHGILSANSIQRCFCLLYFNFNMSYLASENTTLIVNDCSFLIIGIITKRRFLSSTWIDHSFCFQTTTPYTFKIDVNSIVLYWNNNSRHTISILQVSSINGLVYSRKYTIDS